MTADPHADLRAMVEALPDGIQWQHDVLGRIVLRYGPTGFSHDQRKTVTNWLLATPAMVRDLLEERDKLAEQIEDQDDAPEWLSAVDEALGEDRKKAPFIDDAVRLLRKERDALKAEVERLRAAKPAESATIKEKLNEIIARDRIELAKAEAAADAAWRERLLAFEEHRMRCMMAATVLPILAQWGKEHGIEGPFRDAVVNEAHNYADALIAEARRRKECKP